MSIIDIPAHDRIIVALDEPNVDLAKARVDAMIELGITHFKIGKALIDLGVGGEIARYIVSKGGKFFWDNKNIDIGDNTMVLGVQSSIELGAKFCNVMAEAGPRRLAMVAEAAKDADIRVLGVTVLTDMKDKECSEIYGAPVAPTVLRFAGYVEDAGLSGLICSAADLTNLTENGVAQGLIKVTPAIRPLWAAKAGQARPTTPADAIELGADFLVIGRPILSPPDSIGSSEAAAKSIIAEIESALAA